MNKAIRIKDRSALERTRCAIEWVVFFAAFAVYAVFIWTKIMMLTDSDMTAELLLAKRLSEVGGVLTTSYFYGTEIRVLNVQIVYSLLMRFTNDWHMVRFLGTMIFCLMMLAGLYYLLRQAGHASVFPIIATVFLLPFSHPYYRFILRHTGYYTHVILSFFSLGMLLHYAKVNSILGRAALLTGMLVIAGGTGMNGMRQVILFYLPVFCTCAFQSILEFRKKDWDKVTKRMLAGSCACLLAAGMGYLFNSRFLAEYYVFQSYDNINFANFSFDGLERVISGIFTSSGFSGHAIFSNYFFFAVSGILVVCLTVYSAYAVLKAKDTSRQESFLVLVLIFSACLFTGIYTFTSMGYADRYNLPLIVLFFPVIGIAYDKLLKRKDFLLKAGFALAMVFIVISGCVRWELYFASDNTKEQREMAQFLLEKDVKKGYAMYWTGTVMTELTDGEIEVWAWPDRTGSETKLKDINGIERWLQYTSHETEVPEGPVFVMFDKSELKNCPLNIFLYRLEADKETKKYILYLFDSYDDLIEAMTDYKADFSGGKWLTEGVDFDGRRTLYYSGRSYGPDMTMYPGEYEVTIRGEGLDRVEYTCFYGNSQEIPVQELTRMDTEICYRLSVESVTYDVEFALQNTQMEPVVLYEIDAHMIAHAA